MDDGSSSGGSGDGGVPPFGAGMRREHFLFDADYVNLNHGSFGTYPSAVRRQLREIQDAAEARPDHFLRYDSPPRLDIARGALAGLLRVPASEVVLVPNATTGVNTVLRNLRYAPGDAIVYFASIYGACEKTVEYLCETTPVSGFRVDVVYPAEDDVVVGLLRDAVRELKRKGARVRVAMFDTVVSIPGVRTPFELLVEMLREEDPGILTLIDGAHGVGHIPLDLRKLDADFFVSNCHKWLFTPRGSCVMHIPKRNQHLMRSSLPTSHGFIPHTNKHPIPNPMPSSPEKSDFIRQFEFVGTIDNAPYLCVPAALQFRRDVCGGEERIMEYCTRLAHDAGELVADALQTEVLDNSTKTLTRCCFANVRLPLAVGADRTKGQIPHEDVARATMYMTRVLADAYNTFIAVFFHAGNWWVRLSAQVYLELKDFEWCAGVLKEVCGKVRRREYLDGGEAGRAKL